MLKTIIAASAFAIGLLLAAAPSARADVACLQFRVGNVVYTQCQQIREAPQIIVVPHHHHGGWGQPMQRRAPTYSVDYGYRR